MRQDRVQIALESVVLKFFSDPGAVLERRIVQTPEFRKNVLAQWAQYCVSKNARYTVTTISQLARLNVHSKIDEDSAWVLRKLTNGNIESENRSLFPKELSFTGPRYPFEPKELNFLQRKTDTLSGRELGHQMVVESRAKVEKNEKLRKDWESLEEYKWKVGDDDDNLKEDVLAPRYTSF